MCNYCNYSTCGCGGFWNSGYQRICRDCCGNIRVRNDGCGCQNGCGCGCQSGTDTTSYGSFTCGGSTATASTAGCNGGCGASNASSNGYDWYYARQYGLLGVSGCPCGSGYTYDTVTQTTT